MTEKEKVKLRELLETLKVSCNILEELLEGDEEKYSNLQNQYLAIYKNDTLSQNVKMTLIKMGLPPQLLGFSYVQTAIVLLHTSASRINLAKELYPMVAERHNSSYSKVERDIRHAITKLWTEDLTEENLDTIQLILGYSPLNKYRKPTNLEFLYGLAEFFKN